LEEAQYGYLNQASKKSNLSDPDKILGRASPEETQKPIYLLDKDNGLWKGGYV
jgi:hypothetical protein